MKLDGTKKGKPGFPFRSAKIKTQGKILKTQGKILKTQGKNIKNSRKLGNIDFSVNCDFCYQNSNELLNKTLSVDLSCINKYSRDFGKSPMIFKKKLWAFHKNPMIFKKTLGFS